MVHKNSVSHNVSNVGETVKNRNQKRRLKSANHNTACAQPMNPTLYNINARQQWMGNNRLVHRSVIVLERHTNKWNNSFDSFHVFFFKSKWVLANKCTNPQTLLKKAKNKENKSLFCVTLFKWLLCEQSKGVCTQPN